MGTSVRSTRLMRQRDDAVGVWKRRPRRGDGGVHRVHHRHDLRRVPADRALAVQARVDPAADVQPDQRDGPIGVTVELPLGVSDDVRVLERRHVRVEPRPLKLVASAAHRGVRHVRLVVPEAHDVHRDAVQDVDHGRAVVERREKRRAEEVAREVYHDVSSRDPRGLLPHARAQRGEVIEDVDVVDVEDPRAASIARGGRGH
eukprot:31348-Pelagococcus_subviridis.AAC.8